jgi:hypothetical protein
VAAILVTTGLGPAIVATRVDKRRRPAGATAVVPVEDGMEILAR